MKFEISGQGVVCNVYYIEKEKLDEISPLVNETTGPSLKELLIQHSDYIVNVSRGFFASSSLSKFKCVLSNGETIDNEFFEEKVSKIAEENDDFEEGAHERDFRIYNYTPRDKHATSSQVALVEVHEFSDGRTSIDVPCEDKNKISELKLICESVDSQGPKGEEDLATRATYGDGVVGGEETDHRECAIMALEVDGIKYSLPEANFEKSRSRVWLWIYDEESGEHYMDFMGSQNLPDPWIFYAEELKLEDLYENFDQDDLQLAKIHRFFNQQTLDWIKENTAYATKYMQSHNSTRALLTQGTQKLQLPDFSSSNIKLDVCTLLCMFFEGFGIVGYDPVKLSEQDDFEMEFTNLQTLLLGNRLLLKSVQQSFCMHFHVISTISFGEEETFQEISDPSLADAIRFVEEILDDPEASFNQK